MLQILEFLYSVKNIDFENLTWLNREKSYFGQNITYFMPVAFKNWKTIQALLTLIRY